MKKITFFLSSLLILTGATNLSAEVTPVVADGIQPGRVIILHAQDKNTNNQFFGGAQPSNTPYNAAENNFLVVSAGEQGKFYLQKVSSESLYLGKATDTDVNLTLVADQAEAAIFEAVGVSLTATDPGKINGIGDYVEGCDPDKLVRFVTKVNNTGNYTYLNCQAATSSPKYYDGKGAFSTFYVYDAAEYATDGYETSEPVYVGDPVFTPEQKETIRQALETYSSTYSLDNYNAVIAAINNGSQPAEFDPAYHYYIENNGDKGNFMQMEAAGIGWASDCNSAAFIWKLEADGETGKYYMESQGHYVADPVQSQRVTSDAEKTTSFYLINCNNGTFAFDSQTNQEAAVANNNGKGLQKGSYNQVVGWGTAAGTSKWKLKFAKAFTLNVTEAGWASLKLSFPVQLPKELTAYYATGDAGNAILLKSLGQTVPANTAVVIEGPAGIYQLEILPENPAHSISNKFSGTLLAAAPANPDRTYALGNVNGSAKFCLLDQSNTTIAANKAYYEVAQGTGTNALGLTFGEATGIHTVETAGNTQETYYDLNGRRVLYPAKGIYITSNGKKVLLK